MAFPPLWKIRRELSRISDKAVLFASRTVYDPLRKPVHDLTAPLRQRLCKGSHQLTDRVAIIVVYQPKGLAASILLTLEHLQRNGFSTFVVSNGPLREEDRATLAAQAALVMERPNVGYDFGAYRDGIRHLWSLNHDLSRLVLMNDSTWFPLRRDDDSLARMAALGADLAGHVFKTEYETKPWNDHVESHLLMISQDFLRSAEFRRFWSSYRMSNHRSTTIELGEKGLTQMARRAGRSIKTLMSREWLVDTLTSLADRDLRAVLDHTIDSFSQRQPDASRIRHAAAHSLPWRDEFIRWVDESLRNSRSFLLSASFVMPALVYGRMGFAKKTSDVRYHLARQLLIELDASGAIPGLDGAVREEIVSDIRKWSPPKGQETASRARRSEPIAVNG